MSAQFRLRPAAPGDADFLRALHIDSHPELRQLPLPPAAQQQLIQLQIDAQSSQYRTNYPDSLDQLIETDDAPVGRCWTNRSATELRLLDIAVLSAHRGNGIGRAVLLELRRLATAAGLPIRLTVWQDNHGAQRLYTDLGFEAGTEANGYLEMSWPPEPSAAAAAEGA
ncbi:MAG: GNAT family N-acetyltransferase [Actinomycetota bacterium]|nr:GNAT family N-acetyltransferase [Actinomycetota bacterium]MDQ2956681.1 GNAT family N-acetyltransferase [Actinomycetota bacterium]